jgi:hypothetical protein
MATSLAVVALLGLAACKTDNTPVGDLNPPVLAAEAPTPETVAWADQVVTEALAAEKAARESGKDEKAQSDAVSAVVANDAQTRVNAGVSLTQLLAGLHLAAASPRNTPLTKAVLTQLEQAFVSTSGPAGHCPGCKD